jgi:hypothetical protein
MKKTPERTDLHVRMPEALSTWLREAARENDRTLNAEIVQRLRLSFEGYSRL